MNKVIKKIVFTCFLVVSIFFFVTGVKANDISRIDMDIYIDANGNATVTEVWKAYLNSGTQGYKKYSELGNSSISNFTVSDDSGQEYESLPSWNVNASFNSKAYKSGINEISDGVELCWGISNYGNRQYTLKYNISNFVKQYTDTQGIYTNFLDLDLSVSKVTVTIRSDIKFSLENSRIWAFGYNGTINFVDGKIVLDSGGNLSKQQYMVGLVRFNSNIFDTTNKVNKSFDEDYNSAMKDVDKGEYTSKNSIKSIDMDVYIDASGNATVTETWKTYLNKGTEGYRKYTKLGNSSISNFTVSDDSGQEYESLPSWNVNASFNSKAYKSGINEISDGVELCWGISNYGNRQYTLKYNISNFVKQYTDTQGIYTNFLDLDLSVSKVTVTIRSDIKFSLENSRIWAFGYNGTINFVDGKIVLDSGGNLSKQQYMVGLVRFNSNIFDTTNKVSKSFDEDYNSAMKDVSDSSGNNNSSLNSKPRKKYNILNFLLSPNALFIIPAILWIIFDILGKKKGKTWVWGSKRKSGELNFGQYGRTLPSDTQINYWREIPCNKDLERAYWVCYQYSVVSNETLKQGIIGAILLKWIKNGYVTVSKTKKGLFSFKDNNYAINFKNMTHADNEIENELFDMLVSASGFNRILEAKEFSKWSKKNYQKVNSWFSNIIYEEQSNLEQQGLITSKTEETAGMFGSARTINVKNVNPQLREDAIQMKGLKKFLLDFSMMPERPYFEVHIWEEYLIFAQLLGIADKVEEQFSKLYPNFNQVSLLNTAVTTVVIRNMSEICYEGVQYGVARAAERARRESLFSNDYSGSDRDSGGGGSSYDSGGSSAGGSSGGGFR